MTATMETMTEVDLSDIDGGNPFAGIAVAVGAYMGLLDKIEKNPQDYTFLMDWYYS